jgi:hypothetical protein
MNRLRLGFRSGFTALLGVPLLGAVALSGCAGPPPTGQAAADAQTRSACEKRANQVYDQQNRAEIYSPQSQINTPYSANWTPDVTNRGMSDLFAHDRLVSDCVRNTGTGTDRTVPTAVLPTASTPQTK